MNKFIVSFCLFLMICSSCRKCKEGCDVVYRIDGATLTINDSVVSLLQANATVVFSVTSFASKQEGTRNCPRKSSKNCTEDALDANKVALFCNKDLMISGKVYPMNTNLMEQTELLGAAGSGQFGIPNVILNTQSDFVAGRYHFLLQGETLNGKFYQDIAVVEWK